MYLGPKHLKLLIIPALLMLAPVAEARKGKVFFATEEVKDQSLKACTAKFAKAKSSGTLMRNKKKNWETYIVAFFKRKAALGPVTYWVFDKSDKASLKHWDPVMLKSVDWDMKALGQKHFVHNLFFDANFGFNANRTYLVYVGQILNGKNRVYAKGEVTLVKAAPAPVTK